MSCSASKRLLNVILCCFLISGCATTVSLWREDAIALLDRIKQQEGDKILPAEYKSIEDLLIKGELLANEKEIEQADKIFILAWSKGNLLERNLILEKQRLARERKLAEDAERIEAERKQALENELRKTAEEKQAAAKAAEEARKLAEKAEKQKQLRDRQLPAYHTVKRGESLPFIASQSEVYNDRNLWPLLYRANRDQISNPRHIWPGQVLRIPRNASREDINEARRYAQDRPLH